MNTIEAFDIHLEADVATIVGTARYTSGKSGPLRFAFTLDRAEDLSALLHMVDDPFGLAPFVPVFGTVSTDAATVVIAAVRVDGRRFRAGDDPRPQVRTTMEFLPPGPSSLDAHVDYASAFLDLDPADWSRVRLELTRGVDMLPTSTV